ncbi:MAG: helix-turn-helix domain-containing protein [Prevotella sp.]|nr:helix-turn-helix domain-containing protein [Prevotella sp.]
MRHILLTLSLFITNIGLHAQPAYSIRTFTIRDGLASNAITAVEQSKQGLIWIATWNGLCCYDGYQFTPFRGDRWGSGDALSTFRLSTIKSDSRNNIWVRTYDGGLYLYDTHECRYINVGLLVEQHFGVAIHPRNFYTGAGGHTWVTDDRHELNLRIDDRYPTDPSRMEVWGKKGKPLFGEVIRKVETDDRGQEWVITDRGMMRYGTQELREGVFTNYPEAAQRPTEQIKELGNTNKTFVDQQGNVWFASPEGLSLVSFHHYRMRQLDLLPGQETRAVLCRKDGTTWAGSKDGSIAIYDRQGRLTGWMGHDGRPTAVQTSLQRGIYCMKEDSQGNLWIGTKGGGLYLVAANGKTIGHYMPDVHNPYAISNDNIYDIDEDDQGNLWIATYNGGINLVQATDGGVKDGKLRFIHSGNELRGYPKDFARVRRVTHDSSGTMLLSCTEGLLTYSNRFKQAKDIRFYTTRHHQTDTTSLRTDDVLQTLVCRNGAIYVATLGGGIQRIQTKNLQQDNLHLESASLLNQGGGNVWALIEDRAGRIWVVREMEVNVYDPKTQTVTPYGPNSMGGNVEFTEALPGIADNGQLWLPTVAGLLTFDPDGLGKSSYRPNIVFTTLRYQGEDMTRPLLNRQTVTVQKEQRNLTVNFAALDYEDNYLMQYAYRMDGDNGQWNYIGHTPSIAFSQLQPGRHTLVVKSTNCDGMWVDNETTLSIYVVPTFWERTWVQVLAVIIAIALATWATMTYMNRRRLNKEREQRLENIMRQYRELQEQLVEQQSQMVSEPEPKRKEYRLEEPQIVDADEQMMNRLMDFIQKHIGDESLKIEDMAEAVGLGRTVFYGKIKELVGMSPSDFLRQVRMQRAQQLVAKSKLTFSEIAYSVGFTDPKYFTKCFKKHTSMTPSEYRERESAAD